MTQQEIKDLTYKIGCIVGFSHGQEMSELVKLFLEELAKHKKIKNEK